MKRFHHTLIGDLVLGYETFTATDDPYQMLGVYTAEPGSPSADRLKLLASWSATAHRTVTTTAPGEAHSANRYPAGGRQSVRHFRKEAPP